MVTAASGPEAVRIASSDPPELVLLDMSLPGLDGVQVAAEIRRLQGDVPILLMTADSRAQAKAHELGAFDFLQKPFDLSDLIDLVHRGLGVSGDPSRRTG